MSPGCSPDALIQSPELSHQLRGSFVLVAAQVVHGLYGLRGRLQLIFIDVDAFVLRSGRKEEEVSLEPRGKETRSPIRFILLLCTFFHVSTTLAA